MERELEGRIAVVTDGSRGIGQVSYATSKAALEGFTRALSRDLAGRGVLVNAVAPGLIETEMLTAMPAAMRDTLLSKVTLGRIGLPNEGRGACGVPLLRTCQLHHRAGDRRRRRFAMRRSRECHCK